MLRFLFYSKLELNSVKEIYSSMCLPYMKHQITNLIWDENRSESNPFLTKIIVGYWPEEDVELRINFYAGKHSEPNIHSHRWPFYSMILNGSMEHIRYKREKDSFIQVAYETFKYGDIYAVQETEFHTVLASEDLITLLLRGPIKKKIWNQYNTSGMLLKSFEESSIDSEQVPLLREQAKKCLKQLPPLLSGQLNPY